MVPVGEFGLHLQCGALTPVEGDFWRVILGDQWVTLEVVRVAKYRSPQRLRDGGKATHYVKLRVRAAYLEE